MENYEVIKISDDSWRIEDSVVRAFLFTGTERAMLVDSGFGTGNLREVVENITKLPVLLVNTHADGDHIGCNKQFETAYMHPSEFANYYEAAVPEAKVTALRDGAVIDLGGRQFEVILIPGHTPGSIALLDRESKVLIAGDSISAGPIFMFGNGRSVNAFIDSMERLNEMKDSFDTIYPSHGSFPVDTGIISELIGGASKLLKGELEGQEPPYELPAKLYISGAAQFFY